MLKKSVQRGRSERTGESYFCYVEPLSDARTKHGKGRVSVRRGRAGEKNGFFSMLLSRFDDDSIQW